jgi:lysophospholipase L1-like esterase
VVEQLSKRGIRIHRICAGVPGDRSLDMLVRFERDVVARRPDWLVLNCGVNDVWHGAQGRTCDQFRDSVTVMLDRARDAGISVLCTTATVIGEDLAGDANRSIEAYNDVVRTLAATRALRIADCSRAFRDALRAPGVVAGTWLTVDGVHFNDRGETTMARAILDGWMAAPEDPHKPLP